MDKELMELIAGMTPEERREFTRKLKADVAQLEALDFTSYYEHPNGHDEADASSAPKPRWFLN